MPLTNMASLIKLHEYPFELEPRFLGRTGNLQSGILIVVIL